MKVDELRGYLKEWSTEDLLKLYTTTYRKLPKEKKEEIDELVINGIHAPKPKPVPKKPTAEELEATIEELDTFIENAREGYYYYANRIVSKKERSNWRFTCGRFIKFFSAFEEDSQEFDLCNLQLCKIYDILGHACSFYTFASQDPFHTLGYETQSGFFGMIADRVLAGCKDEKMLTVLITCGCKGQNDYETGSRDIHKVLLDKFKDILEYHEVLRITESIFAPVREEYETYYKGQYHGMITEHQTELSQQYKSLGEFIIAIYAAMEDPVKVYQYAMDLDLNLKKEYDLFCILEYYNLSDAHWIQIYEMALKDGIKPREELAKRYKERKERCSQN